MRSIVFFMLVFSYTSFAQNGLSRPSGFKGEHYALYTKCWQAITFCEITQQTYTSCGSVKNCYGLYVLPGDTFYVNIEDKDQSVEVSADISFGGYFPVINNFIFKPIDNNCIPQQALQIAIPLTAVPGSSFQIENHNIAYVTSTLSPGIPQPFDIYVGGQQPQFTFALSDFTVCPYAEEEEVGINELNTDNIDIQIYPNPANSTLNIIDENNQLQNATIEIKNPLGQTIFNVAFSNQIDISVLAPGIYFLTVQDKEKKRTVKVVKE
ncbi:MAG: T9SS type A sorting domain-containing protein [Bacteroidota bacterium]